MPARWRYLFAGRARLLESHRAWDPGAQALAGDLARALNAPALEGRVSRLLIDLNRSVGHRGLFSEFTRPLPAPEREALRRRYWTPHWNRFREFLESLPGRVVHIACHSFTPEFNGSQRNADIGLLYDPGRPREKAWCRRLAAELEQRLPGMRVRMNYPYRGISNGIGQQHRRLFADDRLISMEIEINQRRVASRQWREFRARIVAAFKDACRAERDLSDRDLENPTIL